MKSIEVRKKFLAFFEQKGHKIVPSAPIVVKNDPTLMFTNAGMNQFKDIFLGINAAQYPRVADTQKCLRVSGKHNDLEEVGIDTYHHTMFEMLGNWSFGDYFKAEAIEWAWQLLTEIYSMDPDRLYVTIFEGDSTDGTEKDQESYDIWKRYIAESRILLGNKKDNFWEMGETGPCGPCSEIHVDLRSDGERKRIDGKTLVNSDHPQVVEIWNLVFIQFNRRADKSLQSLPKKHIDTGMGFERLCMALQGKESNYDTDVFQPLIQHIVQRVGIPYGADETTSTAMRVMADHIRAIGFSIGDGQLPSNNGAGYVIRRILRRAVRYGFTFLDIKEPFLYSLIDVMVQQFETVFPDFCSQQAFIKKVIKEEEAAFLHTLSAGINRFEKYAQEHSAIAGSIAFELYDTYGFPIDLTQLLAKEKGMRVDMDAYEVELRKQKERSRAATSITAGDWTVLAEIPQQFVGYDDLAVQTQVTQYREVKAKGKTQYQIVLATTPFYPEGGGQVGDTGMLDFGSEKIAVLDTKKENNLIVQIVSNLPKNNMDSVEASVDVEKRLRTAANHTATHLMHAALREVLGAHVQQKGSLVNDRYLRFDFSHFAKLTNEEIRTVEGIVNQKIRENIPLEEQRAIPLQQAKDLGATALFGEKYGETVRMVTFDANYSRELCGGIHVAATGMIGLFKIISESAVQAGVRRVEAITGVEALEAMFTADDQLKAVRELLKNPKDIVGSVTSLIEENTKQSKALEKVALEKVLQLKEQLIQNAENIAGVHFIVAQVEVPHADALKQLAFSLKQSVDPLYLVLGAVVQGKPTLAVMLSESLLAGRQMNAATIVRALAKEIQGGGGGQPFYATAGGKYEAGLSQALKKARDYIVT